MSTISKPIFTKLKDQINSPSLNSDNGVYGLKPPVYKRHESLDRNFLKSKNSLRMSPYQQPSRLLLADSNPTLDLALRISKTPKEDQGSISLDLNKCQDSIGSKIKDLSPKSNRISRSSSRKLVPIISKAHFDDDNISNKSPFHISFPNKSEISLRAKKDIGSLSPRNSSKDANSSTRNASHDFSPNNNKSGSLSTRSNILDLSSTKNKNPDGKQKGKLICRKQATLDFDSFKRANSYNFSINFSDAVEQKQTISFITPECEIQPFSGWLKIEKDESTARLKKIESLLPQLETSSLPSDAYGLKNLTKFMIKETERIITIAEDILSIMSVTVRTKIEKYSDSGITIFPLQDRHSLANFYKMFVPALCLFPYIFLTKLKISMITVCQQAELSSPTYMEFLEQKLLNGLFIIKRLPTIQHVKDHIFKIVLYHFIKKKSGFYNEWKKKWYESQEKVLNKRSFVDMVTILKCIINPEEIQAYNINDLDRKIIFLKEKLIEFDSDSFKESRSLNI